MKKCSILFISYVLLTCGVIFTSFLNPNQLDYTSVENRELMTLSSFLEKSSSIENFKNGMFQKNLKNLINDQFPSRNSFLEVDLKYEKIRSDVIAKVFGNNEHPILSKNGEFYQINDSGYYTGAPFKPGDEKFSLFEDRLWNFDQIYNKYGNNYKFYIYKPTLADESSWFDESFIYASEGTRYYDRLTSQLDGKYTIKQQEFVDLQDYMDKHFKTDHHWNDKGAYQGYSDIISMIKKDFTSIESPYPIQESFCFDFPFYGSLSMKVMGLYGYDDFCDYKLNTGNKISLLINGEEGKSGLQEEILDKNIEDLYLYEDYHGENYRFMEYTNDSMKDKPSILILGDSFSNSINDDLAEHFYKTYIVDPRAHTSEENLMQSTFSLDDFLNTYDVDIILWLQYSESLYFDSRMYTHIDLNF